MLLLRFPPVSHAGLFLNLGALRSLVLIDNKCREVLARRASRGNDTFTAEEWDSFGVYFHFVHARGFIIPRGATVASGGGEERFL